MSAHSGGPQGGAPDVRSTLLFRTLQKGREKKLGRSLAEAELRELEQYASRAATAGVHAAKDRDVSEAAKAAVASLPKVLPATLVMSDGAGGLGAALRHGARLPAGARPRDITRSRRVEAKARRRAGRAIEDVRVLLAWAIHERRVGPQLPPYARRTSALYVQQEDLDEFIPDGWGATFPAEAGALGRTLGLPPRAVPLLCLLEWTSTFRPASPKDVHGCGSGLQVSLEWLARKLGCTRIWVQALINRLDPFAPWRRECLEAKRENRRRAKRREAPVPMPERPKGEAYLHRFRRLKRYEDTCPEASKRRIWVDAKGKPHLYVDLRGVCYVTAAGRAVLGRPRRRPDAASDVAWGGRRVSWLIAARLRRGHSLLHGRHVAEALENRRELLAAPGVPKDLRPNHPPLSTSPPS